MLLEKTAQTHEKPFKFDESDNWEKAMLSLSVPLAKNLEEAASCANMTAIDSSIQAIKNHAPQLALTLQKLAADFEYEKILSLTQKRNKE